MKYYCNSCKEDFEGNFSSCPKCHGVLTVKAEAWTKISKEKFKAYEEVRRSGMFNMMTDSESARKYASLSREDYVTIISNYSKLKALYGNII